MSIKIVSYQLGIILNYPDEIVEYASRQFTDNFVFSRS